MMHTFGRNYAGLFNGRHGRTGTLWEGRYKACLVDSESCFLACSRYIELNPVRAWMIDEPSEYPWSSYGMNGLGRVDALFAPHASYLALGPNPEARASAYRALFCDALPQGLVREIRIYLQQQKVLGTNRFQSWVAARTGKFAEVRPIGRPSRSSKCP